MSAKTSIDVEWEKLIQGATEDDDNDDGDVDIIALEDEYLDLEEGLEDWGWGDEEKENATSLPKPKPAGRVSISLKAAGDAAVGHVPIVKSAPSRPAIVKSAPSKPCIVKSAPGAKATPPQSVRTTSSVVVAKARPDAKGKDKGKGKGKDAKVSGAAGTTAQSGKAGATSHEQAAAPVVKKRSFPVMAKAASKAATSVVSSKVRTSSTKVSFKSTWDSTDQEWDQEWSGSRAHAPWKQALDKKRTQLSAQSDSSGGLKRGSFSQGEVKRRKQGTDASSTITDHEGRAFNFNTVVVNLLNVMGRYARNVLGRTDKDFAHDWEGARRCIQVLQQKHDVFAVIFENYSATDGSRARVKMPEDIREMLGPRGLQEVPCIINPNHKSADDEVTIKAAYRRNCYFLDNDNYRDWLAYMDDPKVREWLEKYQSALQRRYDFDVGTGTFETLGGNMSVEQLTSDPPDAQQSTGWQGKGKGKDKGKDKGKTKDKGKGKERGAWRPH